MIRGRRLLYVSILLLVVAGGLLLAHRMSRKASWSTQRTSLKFGGPGSALLGGLFKQRGQENNYAPAATGDLTFHRDIAPIIYNKCTRCHYPGSAAPFSLTSFADVKKRAKRIRWAIDRGLMPPWKPHPDSLAFVGAEKALSDSEKGKIEQWLSEDGTEGDAKDGPPPPQPPSEWPSGTPDAIFETEEPYTIAAEGEDIYRCFVIPTNFTEDRFVRMTDFIPGSPAVVHHGLFFADTKGIGRQRDAEDPGPGFTVFGSLGFNPKSQLGGWAPGITPESLPDGVGYYLPKGADLILQIHYHPTGKEETDRPKLGLYFCKPPVDKRVRIATVAVPKKALVIPAGETKSIFWAEQEMPGDITVLQIFPHMHLTGREIAAAALLPDESVIPLIQVDDWDFRWQSIYSLKTPLPIPKGGKIRLEARFDNSASNPRNPHRPPRQLGFGNASTDEMCTVYIFYTVDEEKLTAGKPAPKGYPDSFFVKQWGKSSGGKLR